jgi:cytochrome P450 family 144
MTVVLPDDKGEWFDLADARTLFVAREQGRLPALYRQLVEQAPLWQLPGIDGVYLASTRELVEEAVAKPHEFSSNLTRLLYRDADGGPALYDMGVLDDPGHVLATADPPSHTVQRRLLQPGLSRRAVDEWKERIGAVARDLCEQMQPSRADVATQLADPLTMRVICQLVGVPEADSPELVAAVIAMDRLISGVADRAEMDAGAGAALTLSLRLAEYLNAPSPDGSILSVLSSAIADGVVTEGAAIGILLQVVTAGTETTATLIGHAVQRLAADQRLQHRLRSNPGQIPEFLEHVLRDDGPFQFHSRTSRPGATLGGASLPSGSLVLLMWASANQATPDTTTSHLAFGRGIHFCIGAHLARLEAAIALEALLARTSYFVADPDSPATSRPSLMMARPSAVPIGWEPTL